MFGLPKEPLFGESLLQGVHVATASSDKLLGGPQAGLIIGEREAIRRIAEHPLARVVRVDKLTLASLAATLMLYRDQRTSEIPTIAYLSRSLDEVRTFAERLAASYDRATVEQGLTEVGGGSMPGAGIPTYRCGLLTDSCDALAAALRQASPPVVARIEKGRVWLDPRTMSADEVDLVCGILTTLK
jgi:L-seryl-tRNA(Ser) seleniumtransferase